MLGVGAGNSGRWKHRFVAVLCLLELFLQGLPVAEVVNVAAFNKLQVHC